MKKTASPQTVNDILSTSAHFEKVAADFYGMLAKRFAHLPEVSNYWNELSGDELMHEKLVLSVQHSLSKEKLEALPIKELTTSVTSVQKLLDIITKYNIQTLDDAYELAHQLEFSEVNAVLKLIITNLMPPEKYEEFVTSRIDEHEGKLLQFTDLFGDKSWRKMQKIQPN